MKYDSQYRVCSTRVVQDVVGRILKCPCSFFSAYTLQRVNWPGCCVRAHHCLGPDAVATCDHGEGHHHSSDLWGGCDWIFITLRHQN